MVIELFKKCAHINCYVIFNFVAQTRLWKPCKGWQCPKCYINIHTLFWPVCLCRFELASSQSITTPGLDPKNTPSTAGKTCFLLFDECQASFLVHIETTKICFFMHRNSKLYISLCYKTWLNCTNIQLHCHYITFNSLQKWQHCLMKFGGLRQDFGYIAENQLLHSTNIWCLLKTKICDTSRIQAAWMCESLLTKWFD